VHARRAAQQVGNATAEQGRRQALMLYTEIGALETADLRRQP